VRVQECGTGRRGYRADLPAMGSKGLESIENVEPRIAGVLEESIVFLEKVGAVVDQGNEGGCADW